MIDIAKKDLDLVVSILRKYVPQCEVRAFGSRVTGTAKSYSDLDLAIVCHKKLPFITLCELKEAFEESNIPFRVDVLDWNRISRSFQQVIEMRFEIVLEPIENS